MSSFFPGPRRGGFPPPLPRSTEILAKLAQEESERLEAENAQRVRVHNIYAAIERIRREHARIGGAPTALSATLTNELRHLQVAAASVLAEQRVLGALHNSPAAIDAARSTLARFGMRML